MKTSNQKEEVFAFKTYEAPYQTPFEKLFEILRDLITIPQVILMRQLIGYVNWTRNMSSLINTIR